ncbi:peptide ABC transporter substrate-binding protein [Acetonema longum]|nr:peptide ABC transporter substrate-binding protein [Acetonema longum]
MLAFGLLIFSAACSNKSAPQDSQKKSPVMPGGRLVFASSYEPNTLNPLLSDLVSAKEVASLVFSGLVRMNDKGEWFADLATEVPSLQNGGVSADGRTVTYRLRQNVLWHDGVPFTADDVVFTWQVIMNPRNNIVTREGYDQILSVEAVDKYTVVMKFRQQYPPYLTLFSAILPKHLLQSADFAKTAFHRAPVGTGPFIFKQWRIGEDITLDANHNYHLGKPVLDSILYRIIPDLNVLLTQLKAGQIDIVGGLDLAYLEQIKAMDGVRSFFSPTLVWEHLDLNMDSPLLRDVQVRTAIALGLDRQAIINAALKGTASVAATDQAAFSWGCNPALQPAARNLTAARETLTQAGWKLGTDNVFVKDGRKLAISLMTTNGNKTREIAAQAVAQQLKELGIEVSLRFIDSKQLFSTVLPGRRFDAAMYAWQLGQDPDNRGLWHSRSIPAPHNQYLGKNYSGWRNPEVDNLTDQAFQTMDVMARQQMYYRVQELMLQDWPAIPLYFRTELGVTKHSIVNYQPTVNGGALWNSWQIGFAAP